MTWPEDQNPGGRHKVKPIRDAIRAILSRPANDPLDDEPKTVAQAMALTLVRGAMKGEKDYVQAFKEVRDTAEGKPPQAIVGDKDYDPVEISLAERDRELLKRYIQKGTP